MIYGITTANAKSKVGTFCSTLLLVLMAVGCADERRDHPVFLDNLNDLDRFPSDDRRQLEAEMSNLPRNVMVRVPVDTKGEPRAEAKAEVKYLNKGVELARLSGERMASAWSEGSHSDRARLAHNLRHVGNDHRYRRTYSTQHDLDYHHSSCVSGDCGRGWHGRHHGYKHHGYKHHGYKHWKRWQNWRSPRIVYNSYGYQYPRYYGYRNYSNYTYPINYWYNYYRPYYRSTYYPNLWWGNYRFYNTWYRPGSGYRYFVYCPYSYGCTY